MKGEPAKYEHVDDFIDNHKLDKYARWMLNHFRLPADLKYDFAQYMEDRQLYCTYENKRWRVTGCSATFGDVWLRADFKKDFGYDLRVPVDECVDWGAVADPGAFSEFEQKTKMLRRASNMETIAQWVGAPLLGILGLTRYVKLEFQSMVGWSLEAVEPGEVVMDSKGAPDIDVVLEDAANFVRKQFKGE